MTSTLSCIVFIPLKIHTSPHKPRPIGQHKYTTYTLDRIRHLSNKSSLNWTPEWKPVKKYLYTLQRGCRGELKYKKITKFVLIFFYWRQLDWSLLLSFLSALYLFTHQGRVREAEAIASPYVPWSKWLTACWILKTHSTVSRMGLISAWDNTQLSSSAKWSREWEQIAAVWSLWCRGVGLLLINVTHVHM